MNAFRSRFIGCALCMAGGILPGAQAAALPSPNSVLNLADWHLTLPLDSKGGTTGTAVEIDQPQLATYSFAPWFQTVRDTVRDSNAVAFRAFAGGAKTSSNTIFARTELRERNADYTPTAWVWNDGLAHTMKLREAIKTLTKVHPHTAAGQIHDESNDVFMLKAQGTNPGGVSTRAQLVAYFDNSTVHFNVDTAYVLGVPFDLEVVQQGQGVSVKYNGKMVISNYTTFPNTTRKANYFKAGCYIQTNVSKYGEDSAAYAEVWVYSLSTTHQKPSTIASPVSVATRLQGRLELYSLDGRKILEAVGADADEIRRGRAAPGSRAGVYLVRDGSGSRPILLSP